MVEFNKDELLNNFDMVVKNHEYEPLPYKEWRALKTSPGDVIILHPHVDKSNKICIHWKDTLTQLTNYINTYDINDGSFGAYVNRCIKGLTCVNTNINIDAVTDLTEITKEFDDAFKHFKTNINKENKKMDTSNLFNFDFGPASSNQFRMSPYGLAVRTQANGWVAYNAKTGDLMDVDILNFDISKMIYKMPVALTAIKPGDILMHGGKPVFVREVATGDSTVRVIDYTNATVADILPVKSPFGFNFFTKVCPLFNFDQASANSDNPFGNMLPFLMLNGEKDGNFDPTLLFMASVMNGGNMDFTSNPMMLYCLMNRQDKGDILPFVMMMNGGLFGVPSSNATPRETKEVPASTNTMEKASI